MSMRLLLCSALLCGLMAGVARADEHACDPGILNEQLLNLFPPAGEDQRLAALKQLADCRDQRLAGPISVVLQSDPKGTVRIEATRSLAKTGGSVARDALVRVLKSKVAPADLWEASAKGLIDLKEVEPVRAILFDWQAPNQQRTAALALLDAHEPLPKEDLEFLAQDKYDGVKSAASALLTAREPPPPPTVEPPPTETEGPPSLKTATLLPPPEKREVIEAPALPEPETPEVIEPRKPPNDEVATKAVEPPLPVDPPPVEDAPPAIPEVPRVRDGTTLAVATSTVAGASLMSFLTLLGQQNNTGVLMLTGTAGAVIGGGTAWGLTRLKVVQPTLAQAAWYTNVTAWGTLAGLSIYSGSGLQNDKAKWGLLVGGEGLGMVVGAITAKKWDWTPEQMVLADSMLLSLGLTDAGVKALRGDPPGLTARAAIGIVPAMIGTAALARAIKPTSNDMHLIATMSVASSVTGTLLASGGTRENAFSGAHGRGGFLTGLGLGYMGAVIASGFTDVAPSRSWMALSTMVVGNLLGRGASMMARPGEVKSWNLGSGVGGLAIGTAAFIAQPYLRFRGSTIPMMVTGAVYGSGIWGLSSYASYHGQALTPEQSTQFKGSLIVGGAAGSLVGLVASRWFDPDAGDYIPLGILTSMGFSSGLGIARLSSPNQGTPDQVGALLGSAAGLIGGAALLRKDLMNGEDIVGGLVGSAYGTFLGALAPTLGDATWSGGRSTQGGVYAGYGLGALAGGLLAHTTHASYAQVGMSAQAGIIGLAVGTGLGWMWPIEQDLTSPFTPVSFGTNSQTARIGAVGGTLAAIGGAMLLERPLHLSEGFGPSVFGLGLSGITWGTLYGTMLAAAVDPSGTPGPTPSSRLWGGALFGASTGLATGLVLSKLVQPHSEDYQLAWGAGTLGGALGYGISLLATDQNGRRNTLGFLIGSGAALGTGAWASRYVKLTGADELAGVVGAGFGGLIGAELPSIAEEHWQSDRTTGGALLIGSAVLGTGATALAHWKQATVGEVMVPTWAGIFGLTMGAGLGGVLPLKGGDQAERVGAMIGFPTLVAGSLLLDRKLHLSEGLGDNATRFAFTGSTIGAYFGLLLVPSINAPNEPFADRSSQYFDGALFGSSLGAATGLVASKFFSLDGINQSLAFTGTLVGTGFGWGLGMVSTEQSGRTEATLRLTGALLGLGAAAVTQKYAPLTQEDGIAALAAGSYGVFLGALAPSLGQSTWSGFNRPTTGWTLLGSSALIMGGMAARHATGASSETVGLGTLGALDGMATGIGLGMLAANTSQSNRVGLAVGSLVGAGIGLGLWPRTHLSSDDASFIAASTVVGGWTGLWLGTLNSPKLGDARGARVGGGALAGVGVASLVSSVLASKLEPAPNRTKMAVLNDSLLSLAGLGAGLLASDKDNVATGAMLAAGTAGLLLGAARGNAITDATVREGDGDMSSYIALSTIEGAFIGGFLPYAVRPSNEVTQRQQIGGLLVGTFAGAGLSLLTSPEVRLSPKRAWFAGTTSLIGGALAGGVGLLNENWSSQAKTATMLSGTAIGVVGGGLLSRNLKFEAEPAPRVLVGTLLGVAEGLTFAWSARAQTNSQWAGAGLVGGGVGAALGLASAVYPRFTAREAPATAGFAAWGAWMGSFSGSLIRQDSRDVTMGGLLGANVGAATGYALVRAGKIQPADFGWLSLFGGIGTVIGGGIGAPFATKDDARPVLAGLAIGPAVGLITGYLLLPKLRAAMGSGGDAAPVTVVRQGWRIEE